MNSTVNVADVERWASALGGAALTAYGIKQLRERSPAGAALAAAGSALIYRGASGHCPVYAATGFNTVEPQGDVESLSGSRGINVEEVVTVNASASTLYAFWRRLELLPQFMGHLVSVSQLDPRRSRWIAKAPSGRVVEWDAEIVNEITGELIAWRALQNANVTSTGSVTFRPEPGGRGTRVHLRLQYDPPAAKLRASVAWLMGHDPAAAIREDLRRFKQLMEAGELPTIHGQPHGKQSSRRYA
jgi:uncharacterized membrane protein